MYLTVLSIYSVVPAGTPGTGLVRMLPGGDLAAHGLTAGGLALLLCCALRALRTAAYSTAGLAIILAGVYVAALELVQGFLPWRTSSLVDLAAGLGGILLAVGAWLALRRLFGRAGTADLEEGGSRKAPHRP